MFILITQPAFRSDEAQLMNHMLEQHSELLVHIRKPDTTASDVEQLVAKIAPEFHARLVLHQHYEIADQFSVKGIHHTTSERLKQNPFSAISTSFHSISEALDAHSRYTYFFCSPVFQSISKPGYSAIEHWDITQQTTAFREKAIALGGITRDRLTEAFQRGFQHIAVLGSVWQQADPVHELHVLQTAYSQTIITFADSHHL